VCTCQRCVRYISDSARTHDQHTRVAAKLTAIKTYILPAMTYGMEVWWPRSAREIAAMNALDDVLVRASKERRCKITRKWA